MKIAGIFFISILFICSNTNAQKISVDSLINIINTAPDDTNKVIAYRAVCGILGNSDPKESLSYGYKGVTLAKKIKWDKGVAGCYLNLGNTYGNLSMYDSALVVNDSALVYALKVGDANRIALVYINRAAAYIEISKLEEAMQTIMKALPHAEKANNPDRLARVYMTMANISFYQENWQKSIDDYRKSLPLFMQANTKNMVGTCYMNIATCYKNLGQFDSSIVLNTKAIEIFSEVNDVERLMIAYHNNGTTKTELKNYAGAEADLLKSGELAKSFGDKEHFLLNQSELAELYVAQNDYNKAIQILIPAIDTAQKYLYYKQILNISEILSDLSFKTGDYKKAFTYLQIYNVSKDTIAGRAANERLMELQTQYETVQKDKEIELLNKESELQQQKSKRQRAIIFSAVGFLILSIISLFLLINRNKIRQQVKELKLRNNIALDLHDEVGSSLSSVKMLSEMAVMQENNKDILQKISNNAKETVEKMSDIIWMINPKYDQLENMSQRMEKFLYQMCSPKSIQYELKSDFSDNLKLSMLQRKDLLMIFKEGVNNAVKYSEAKKITVSINQVNHHLELQIKDDGRGFDIHTIEAGNGLDNMKIRAQELHAILEVNSQINTGTEINISIPLLVSPKFGSGK